MILPRPKGFLTSRFTSFLSKAQRMGFVVAVVGLGILLGSLINSPQTTELAVSLVAILAVLLITVNRPLDGVLVWLILVPFVETWVKISMGAGLPDLSFSRFVVTFIVLVLLARAAVGVFRFHPISLADLSIAATTIGLLLAAPLSASPTGAVQTTIAWHFTPLAIFFLAKNLVRTRNDLHRILQAMVLVGVFVASYAVFEQTTGIIWFLPQGQSAVDLRVDYTESLRMIRGLLGRPGNFGRVFISTIPITFYLFFEEREFLRRNVLAGALLVQAFGLFLTYNRTSYYAFLISLTVMQLFFRRFRKAFFAIAFVAAIILGITWNQVAESALVTERINSRVSTLEGREQRWQTGLNMWLVKPIRGWGFGRYEQESGLFNTSGAGKALDAIENDYLNILVSSGVMGFLPYSMFLLAPLISSVRLFYRARTPVWSGFITTETIAVYWAVLVAFAIGSYTQIQIQPIVKMIPFGLAGAVIGSHEHLLGHSRD